MKNYALGKTVMEADADEDFLVQEGLRWGGEIASNVEAQLRYQDLIPEGEDWINFQEWMSIELGLDLFFGARPDRDYRVFGKLRTTYPFEVSSDPSVPTGPTIPHIDVFEPGEWEILAEGSPLLLVNPRHGAAGLEKHVNFFLRGFAFTIPSAL